ncbi:fibronectin type III-like domain-contianing protein, partial [Klebsiella variicola]
GLGYADITLNAAALTGDEVDGLQLRCQLQNRAARDGKAVVQLYLRGPQTAWSALAEFAAVSVPAHDEATLTLDLPRHALQRWQVPAQEWQLASGPWQLAVGFASDDIRATFDFVLTPDGKISHRG